MEGLGRVEGICLDAKGSNPDGGCRSVQSNLSMLKDQLSGIADDEELKLSAQKCAVGIATIVAILFSSACGWSSEKSESIFPEFTVDTEITENQTDQFVSLITQYGESEYFSDPDIARFPVFGATSIYMENDDFIIIGGNEVDKNVFSVSFYCNYKACDLEELEALAKVFLNASKEAFKASSLVRRSNPEEDAFERAPREKATAE